VKLTNGNSAAVIVCNLEYRLNDIQSEMTLCHVIEEMNIMAAIRFRKQHSIILFIACSMILFQPAMSSFSTARACCPYAVELDVNAEVGSIHFSGEMAEFYKEFDETGDYYVDVAEFLALIDQCEGHAHRRREVCHTCVERLRRVAALYRGHFLAGFFLKDNVPYEEWALIVREQLMRQLGEELPYATTVEIERFTEDGNLLRIGAVIWVEREGQKAIVIGKGGARLKEIGAKSRLQMERLFGAKVFLETWVRVREGWSDDEAALKAFGYE